MAIPDRPGFYPDRASSPEKRKTSLIKATRLEPHGMCGGVVAAVNFTELLLNKVAGRELVYTFNQVVHNHKINHRFQGKGLSLIVERTSEGEWPYYKVPRNSLALLSAHGHKEEDIAELEARGCIVILTLCPLVKNEWGEVGDATSSGKMVLLFGKPGHPEVRGTMAHAPKGSVVLVSSVEDIERYVASESFNPHVQHVMANQTTQSIRDVGEVRRRAIELISLIDVNDRRGGCYATDNRQKAAEVALTRDGADALLVVGSGDISNNTYNLAKVALDLKKPSWTVNDASEIDWNWFAAGSGIEHLALTSSASCEEEDFNGVALAVEEKSVEIYYQEPVVKEKKTEFPIPAYEKLPLLDERYRNWSAPQK